MGINSSEGESVRGFQVSAIEGGEEVSSKGSSKGSSKAASSKGGEKRGGGGKHHPKRSTRHSTRQKRVTFDPVLPQEDRDSSDSDSESEYVQNVQLAMNKSLGEKKGMSSEGSTSNEPPKK